MAKGVELQLFDGTSNVGTSNVGTLDAVQIAWFDEEQPIADTQTVRITAYTKTAPH